MRRFAFQSDNSALPRQFIKNLPPDFFDRGGMLIHNVRNQIKVFDVNEYKVNVKKYCIPPVINRILYSCGLRTPKAQKTFSNAQKIRQRGFNTPAPYGYIIERNRLGLITYSYFFSEQLEGVTPLGQTQADKPLITDVARFTADLHTHGLLHMDYTANNILYRTENGKRVFYLVDINRFRFRKKAWPVRAVLNNLIKPFWNDEELAFFVQQYAALRHAAPEIVRAVLRLRHLRNRYDDSKDKLKKIPGAYLLLNQPLNRKKYPR